MGRIFIAEPLRYKLANNIMLQCKDVLNKSKIYGTIKDYRDLKLIFDLKYNPDKFSFSFIDFTSFDVIRLDKRREAMISLSKEYEFLAIARDNSVGQELVQLGYFPVAICRNDGIIKQAYQNRMDDITFSKYNKMLNKYNNYDDIHNFWVDSILRNKIRDNLIYAKNYRFNNTVNANMNLFIDIKNIIREYWMSFYIAYQIGHKLSNGYTNSLEEKGFIACNNTAYVIASMLQLIFDSKSLIYLDKLIAKRKTNIAKLNIAKREIQKNNLIIIEDIVATGREVDMLYILTRLLDGYINRAASVIKYSFAKTRLLDVEKDLTSLINLDTMEI